MNNILLLLFITPLYLFSQISLDFNDLVNSKTLEDFRKICVEANFEVESGLSETATREDWASADGWVLAHYWKNSRFYFDTGDEVPKTIYLFFYGIDGQSEYSKNEFERLKRIVKNTCKFELLKGETILYSCDFPMKAIVIKTSRDEEGNREGRIRFNPSFEEEKRTFLENY